MKLLILCAALAGCATSGMISKAQHEHLMTHNPLVRDKEELEDCLQEQIDYYGDLCAEGIDTHTHLEEPFRTMLCGLQGVANCIGVKEPAE